MKNQFNRFNWLLVATIFVLSGLVFATPGISASVDKSASSTSTQEISGKVHHELAMLPFYGVFDNLQYQVNGTEVTLSGQVVSEHSQTRNDAGNVVQSIPGVTKVVNNIEVLPPSTFDNQIRRAEYRSIFTKSDLGRYTLGAIPSVHIVVKNGHVTLDGVVMNQFDKTVAEIAAKEVPGVFSVTNNLRIGSV